MVQLLLRKKFAVIFGIVAAIAMFQMPLTAAYAQSADALEKAGTIVPGRYIVRFQANERRPDRLGAQLAAAHGFSVRHIYRHGVSGMAIDLNAASELRVLNALARNPAIQSISNDRYAVAFADTIPTGLDRVYGFDGPGIAANTGSGVRVAVIDTGIDFLHPDLSGRVDLAASRNCIGGCVVGGQDDEGHGSHVSGTIAASDNGSGVLGIVPQATLVAVKVLDSNGSGSFSDIAAGVDYLTGLAGTPEAVQIANMSLGAYCSVCTDGTDPANPADPEIQFFHDKVIALVNSGTTLVVAAGNDSGDAKFAAPASFDEAITVSAVTDIDGQPGGTGGALIFPGSGKYNDDTLAKFSNYGEDVDVAAPGVNIESVNWGGGTATGSGTSMASPHVAGMAALFMQAYRDAGGTWPNPALVKQALIETGECADGMSGGVFHDGLGCNSVWANDRDGIPEPMARADMVVDFGPPLPTNDVAVTSVSAPSPVVTDSSNSVSVAVENQGTETESFIVTLDDDLDGTSVSQSVSELAPGLGASLSFNWSPVSAGTHILLATASVVGGETDFADNTATATSDVMLPTHDVAVVSLTAPGSVTQGSTATVSVDVSNEGTYAETFDVVVSDITAGTSLGVQGVTLASGSSTALGFDWVTDGSTSLGDHTLRAVAATLSGETDTVDNTGETTSTVEALAVGVAVGSITPNAASAPDTSVDVTISGSGFSPGASVTFENGGGKAPAASNITVVDSTTITATVTVSYKGPNRPRLFDVRVTNADGGTDVLVEGFVVQP